MEESIITRIFLPVALAIIMFGMGLGLTVHDFKRVFKAPKIIFIGLLCQIILLPILAFGICLALNLPPEFSLGLMVLAASPGGATSNLITHLAKGNTALSVSLTAVSSTITMFSAPLIVQLAIAQFGLSFSEFEMPFAETVLSIFLITMLPVSLGMIVKNYKKELAEKSEKTFNIISAIILVIIIVGAISKNKEVFTRPDINIIIASTLLLNILSMLLGFLIPAIFSASLKDRVTISIETGIQNATLGIVISATLLQNATVAIIPAMYGIIMFISAAGFIASFRKKNL